MEKTFNLAEETADSIIEQVVNGQYDIYEKAKNEYRKVIKEQADEIERLREALQIIVNCDPSDFEVTDIVEFARSALQQKDSE